jgi:hypothetical protein
MTNKTRRVPTAPTPSTAFAVQATELPNALPDALIDRALHSLRDTQPPTGLEARVAARLAQAADASAITSSSRTPSRSSFAKTSSRASFFAVILSLAKDPRILLAPAPISIVAAAALLAITVLAVNHHQKPNIIANSNPQPSIIQSPPSNPTKTSNLANTQDPEDLSPTSTQVPQGLSPAITQVPQGLSPAITQVPQGLSPAITQVPQGFSLGSHRSIEKAGVLTPASTDPDTLALAETLAPSHPAPPMPLTAQEHLLILATRQGQPIELAELETLRKPALQAAAEARQNATIRRYAESLLGPLATAAALHSTSDSPAQDDTPAPQPPSSK